MNSLIVSAILITASGAWAQQSAPPASDQTLTTAQVSGTPKAARCSAPPALDQKSVAAFEQQAASGDAAAQCGLGLLYDNGIGVPQDYAKAVYWYRKAAEQGFALAQYNLGRLYPQHGQRRAPGLPSSDSVVSQGRGTRLRRGARRPGGSIRQRGRRAAGLRSTVRGIARRRNRASKRRNPYSRILYLNGRGVPQDYAQAALWYRKAAEQGEALRKPTSGLCTTTATAFPRTTHKRRFGIARRPSRARGR